MYFVENFPIIIASAITTLATLLFGVWHIRIKHFFRKEEVSEKFNGGALVAKVLHYHEVSIIFTLIGGHISPIVVAAEKAGIRVVDTRNEATAVFAADAAARLSGKLGVAVVTAGPGVTNCVTAAKNAQLAESPVLIIGGAAATILKGRGSLQDIDQVTLYKTVCKFTGSASTVREIVPLLREAIRTALSGVPGPVFVELPVDLLYQFNIVAAEVLPKMRPKTLSGHARYWYLRRYLSNLYSGWAEPHNYSPMAVSTPKPNKYEVLKCARLLRRAKRPFIVVGSQAMLPPITTTSLQAAINCMKVPVSLGGMARGLLGKDNPLQFRYTRKHCLQNADFIILAGAICDFRLGYGRTLRQKATIVSVNRDKAKASLNAGIFWAPSLVVKGDVATFLVELASVSVGNQYDDEWLPMLREAETKRWREIVEASRDSSEFLDPVEVLMELERQIPQNSIIIGDGGDFVGTASYILKPSAPLTWLDPGPFGTLGVGGGFALGAKLVRPDAMVWVIYGDGACGYSIVEYDTFVRHQIPVIAVVGNDACWSQIERDQRPMLGESTACMLAHSNYHVVARGLGAEGMLVTKTNPQWQNVVRDAIQTHENGKSILLNILIQRSDFRKGSISL